MRLDMKARREAVAMQLKIAELFSNNLHNARNSHHDSLVPLPMLHLCVCFYIQTYCYSRFYPYIYVFSSYILV
jgi:hypothetical protein